MPTACIQCSMRALLTGEPVPIFDETPEAHAARVHPDPEAAARERQELEAAIRAAGGPLAFMRRTREE